MARALVSAIAKELGSIIASDLRLTVSVKEEVQKLESKFRTIQAVLNDAEKRQLKDEAVKLWLDKPKDVSYEMDDVLDEWNTAMIKADIKKQEKEEEEKKRKLKLVLLRRGSLFLTDKEDKINLKEETPSRTSRIQLRKEMNMILTPPLTKEIEEDDASQIYYMNGKVLYIKTTKLCFSPPRSIVIVYKVMDTKRLIDEAPINILNLTYHGCQEETMSSSDICKFLFPCSFVV
ncbi:uncharacterized protein LOC142629725 isoform X1 [Castanea sativa]|uniref:uncharacterized protein LOC142629725 isoform X1 n=1 Tax=Castanea sativa TaxID=21020 RepID=UPI003F64C17C